MRNRKRLVMPIAAAVVVTGLLASPLTALGQTETKWIQPPDETGWAVNATAPLILADDFECTETGWIKNIHFWGAWLGGNEGTIQSIVLSLHADIPAEQNPGGYSKPGDTLWEREITEWEAVPVDTPNMQGWYSPDTGEHWTGDHSDYWRYNVILPEQDWFWQEAGTVYWLNISVNVEESNRFWGWKSTTEHWNDDACWAEGGTPAWQEMLEPPKNPMGDDFFLFVDVSGDYLNGGGSGFEGTYQLPYSEPPWFLYESGWWNQWYYNGAFEPERGKWVDIDVESAPFDAGEDMYYEMAINWSTPEWSALGHDFPPLPYIPPDQQGSPPIDEELYIGREVLVTSTIPEVYELQWAFTEYNPEWISIDIRGYNFKQPGAPGWIEHACVPSLDLSFEITGSSQDVDWGDAVDSSQAQPVLTKAHEGYGGELFDFTEDWNGYFNWLPMEMATVYHQAEDTTEFVIDMPREIGVAPDNFDLVFDAEPDGVPDWLVHWYFDADGKDPSGTHWSCKINDGGWSANQALPAWITATPDADPCQQFHITVDNGQLDGEYRFALQAPLSDEGYPEHWTGEAAILVFPLGASAIFSDSTDFETATVGDSHLCYPTLAANNGANHVIAGPWLGDTTGAPDAEVDGQPDAGAAGDDNDGNDDEDGVLLPAEQRGGEYHITFEVNTAGAGAIVEGWCDWNGDGDWGDAGELLFANSYTNGIHTETGPVDPGAPDETFARFRISTAGTGSPRGRADDGEVEDYALSFHDCPDWDTNCDHIADLWDLLKVDGRWADTGPPGWCREDIDNDGIVDLWDLQEIDEHWAETW